MAKRATLPDVLRRIAQESQYTLEVRIAEKLTREFPRDVQDETELRHQMSMVGMSDPLSCAILNALRDRKYGFPPSMAPSRTYLTEET